MDYDYSAAAGLGVGQVIIGIACCVLVIVAMWKIFAKAGKPGWAAIVPFYNLYVLFEITWGSGIKFLLLLIPFANFVISIITMVKLAKVFGKGGGFAAGLIFLGPIFQLILAFGSAQYVGINGAQAAAPAPEAPVAPAYTPAPEAAAPVEEAVEETVEEAAPAADIVIEPAPMDDDQ